MHRKIALVINPLCSFAGAAIATAAVCAMPASAAPDQTLGIALMAAAVNADGTLARGSGQTGSTKVGTGDYEVDFGRDVTGCFYTVSTGAPSAASVLPGMIQAEPRGGTPNGVFVKNVDGSGAPADTAFYLTVLCTR